MTENRPARPSLRGRGRRVAAAHDAPGRRAAARDAAAIPPLPEPAQPTPSTESDHAEAVPRRGDPELVLLPGAGQLAHAAREAQRRRHARRAARGPELGGRGGPRGHPLHAACLRRNDTAQRLRCRRLAGP